MLNRLIEWSLAHRGFVIVSSALILVLGILTAFRLPVEVLPDLTRPTVIILTEAPGLAPEEVENRITQPIETALMGIAGLTRLRSNSDVSLSLVYAEFEWNSDLQKNRLLVQERLQAVREQLPVGIQPFLTPPASLMGEILLVSALNHTQGRAWLSGPERGSFAGGLGDQTPPPEHFRHRRGAQHGRWNPPGGDPTRSLPHAGLRGHAGAT